MKPPSSDAEPLGDEHAAQIRAANRLFVASDELRDFKRGHQAIWQARHRGPSVGRQRPAAIVIVDIVVRLFPHGILHAAVALNVDSGAEFFGNEPGR